MSGGNAKAEGSAAKAVPATRRRFTVLWTANQQDRRSAPMTEAEAATFAQRLRSEKAAAVRVEEETGRPALRGTGRAI
jgi:hypothetical protein